MRAAIIYYSKHHGNTKKILDYLCKYHDITLIDTQESQNGELTEYDAIGFASGIYYSRFHKSVIKYAENNLPENKKVFFIYTYGAEKDGYTKAISEAAASKSCDILGEFGCFGFNTFGPFKLIGGIAKGHHDDTDFDNALKFYNGIIKY